MTGRGRNKRKGAAVESEADILRRVQSAGIVTTEDVVRLFHLDRPGCQCRSNSKDSPHCFCGFIPAANSSRKQGLWQKLSEITDDFGADPSIALRKSMETPAGLTNLGATCYANSVLQSLYMNTAFRSGLFRAEMEVLREDASLKQLVRLFTQMQCGNKMWVDPGEFTGTLQLDREVQQDGQEFLKLLLGLLERVLGKSEFPETRFLVQSMFQGTFSYVTKCRRCGNESDASSNLVTFYETELNVKGFTDLESSLDDFQNEQKLEGENQYSCDHCQARADATHSTKFRRLPLVMNFQLKRFVFDARTASKKKVTEPISFPRVLDMEKRVTGGPEGPAVYELSAILLHKGKTATSGHYVAHIKDERLGYWWQFDDEEVSVLGSHPLGVEESKARAKDKEPMVEDDGPLTSSDAYILLYRRRVLNQPEERPRPPHECLRQEVAEQNECFLSACSVFNEMKVHELGEVEARRTEVRSILADAARAELSNSKGFWISTEWLRNWADNRRSPPPINNTELVCQHGRASSKKLHLMKCIPESAWEALFSKYGGGPTISTEDYCSECILADAAAAASAESFRSTRAAMKEMAERVMSGKNLNGQLFYVSKTWLTQWLRKKAADAPGESDAIPTNGITCRHGGLLPEQAQGAKRQAIPEVLWSYFYQVALGVRKENTHSLKAFPVNTETCRSCDADLNQTACKREDLRATKMEQRQKQEAVFSGRSITLVPGVVYYLVPSDWLSKWRSYIGASGKNVLEIDEPLSLESHVVSLLCSKHEGLQFKPPVLTRNKRGEVMQKPTPDDAFTVVSHEDYVSFCQEWGMDVSRGIKAFLEVGEDSKSSVEEASIPVLRTEPELCGVCIGDRESIERNDKLNYTNSVITVELVQGKEPPAALLDPSGAPDVERRCSKRTRRTLTTGGKRVSITVSGNTTVYQLKLLIWENLGVVKENQEVHFGRAELADESATLSASGVFPGARLWVSDNGLHEQRDIAEELSVVQQQNQIEEGFRGTRLLNSCLPVSNGVGLEHPGIC